jgi:electron transport complex protein RnfA
MATFFGFCSALGFTIAIIIFAGIRGKLEEANIPEPFKNVPIAFVTAAILAMAFMGFSGLVK